MPAGVVAMGFGVKPDMEPDEVFDYIRETGTLYNRGKLINPKAFIEKVKGL